MASSIKALSTSASTTGSFDVAQLRLSQDPVLCSGDSGILAQEGQNAQCGCSARNCCGANRSSSIGKRTKPLGISHRESCYRLRSSSGSEQFKYREVVSAESP